MAVTVTFNSNLDEVLHLLRSAKAKALTDIGTTVQKDAATNSPVRTGALRGSWTVEVDEDESAVTIGVPLDQLEGNYAKYVELGTTKQSAKHMLRNAVQDNQKNFRNIITVALKNA